MPDLDPEMRARLYAHNGDPRHGPDRDAPQAWVLQKVRWDGERWREIGPRWHALKPDEECAVFSTASEAYAWIKARYRTNGCSGACAGDGASRESGYSVRTLDGQDLDWEFRLTRLPYKGAGTMTTPVQDARAAIRKVAELMTQDHLAREKREREALAAGLVAGLAAGLLAPLPKRPERRDLFTRLGDWFHGRLD